MKKFVFMLFLILVGVSNLFSDFIIDGHPYPGGMLAIYAKDTAVFWNTPLTYIAGNRRNESLPFTVNSHHGTVQVWFLPIGLNWPVEDLEILYDFDGEQTLIHRKKMQDREYRDFTINLDARLTSIRTDDSAERAAQTQRLREILQTTNPATRYLENSVLQVPVEQYLLSSLFGDRRTFIYNDGTRAYSYHFGIDYALPTGQPVNAAGSGRVVLVENRIVTGKTLVIEHLPGVYSLYYHLDTIICKEGELVRTGTLIGTVGSTGLSTGPHLHWELRVNGEAVDPELFLHWRVLDKLVISNIITIK